MSCDQYGFTTKPNREGTRAVYPLPEEDPQLYFKADLEGHHLTPGREGFSFCVYQILFGGGVTPSCLLSLLGIPWKTAPLGSEAYTMFERKCNTQNSTTFFANNPQYQIQFERMRLRSGIAQVSSGVDGELLDSFLERIKRGEARYGDLDPRSVSLHMLAHYILGVSDGKGDNVMTLPLSGRLDGLEQPLGLPS